jgi:hypothetical protein
MGDTMPSSAAVQHLAAMLAATNSAQQSGVLSDLRPQDQQQVEMMLTQLLAAQQQQAAQAQQVHKQQDPTGAVEGELQRLLMQQTDVMGSGLPGHGGPEQHGLGHGHGGRNPSMG